MIKVLIVDDHALVRLGIRRLVDEAKGIQVVAEASTGEELLRKADEFSPDVVLLDVKMPGMGGLEATRRLKRRHPNIGIIVLSAFQEEPFLSLTLQAGASGYLTKECGVDEMIEAIHKVHTGSRYLSLNVAQQLALKNVSDKNDKDSIVETLSERELQIMFMISSGLKVQDISQRLHLSPKTVNTYRYRLFEKLDVENDVGITRFAINHGLLEESQLGRVAIDEE